MALIINVEGAEGAGKSAVIRLIDDLLVAHGFTVLTTNADYLSIDRASEIAKHVATIDSAAYLVEVKPVPVED